MPAAGVGDPKFPYRVDAYFCQGEPLSSRRNTALMESKTYSGRIAVGDDSPLEVALRVTADQLQVAAGAVDIGTWPIADCTIRANGNRDFALHVDGDAIHFTPDDHGDFVEMVASIDQGTLSGFLSGVTGLEGVEAAPKPAPKKRRAAKPRQAPPSTAEVDVAESGLADSEPVSAPPEVAVEAASKVEEMAERAPKHKKPRPAPKGTPRAPKRVVMDDLDQVDVPVEVEPGPSRDTSFEIEPGPEPVAAQSIVSESLVSETAADDRLDEVGLGWEIDPGPEPEPVGPLPEEPVEEIPVVDEAGPDDDARPVAVDTGPDEAVLDLADEGVPDLAGEPAAGLAASVEISGDDAEVAAEGEPARDHDAVVSTESPTERILAIESDPEELRRNFGQRLGRRRIAPIPPVGSLDGEDGSLVEVTAEPAAPEEEIGTDAGSLAAAVEALRQQADSEESVTVADAIIASQRSLRESSTKPSRLPAFLKRFAILTGVILLLGGLGLGGFLAIRLLTQDAEPTGSTSAQPSPTTDGSQVNPSTSPVATTAPPTTEAVPETTVAPFQPTAFALTAPEFVKRWNETAASVNPQLALPSLLPGEFEFQLTPYVAVAGTVGASGSVDNVTMTIDPTGPSEADVVGLQAMGMFIAVADPNLDGPGRRDLLASMGLDVGNPVLIGLDSATVQGGIAYRLFFDDVAQRLFFTAGAG